MNGLLRGSNASEGFREVLQAGVFTAGDVFRTAERELTGAAVTYAVGQLGIPDAENTAEPAAFIAPFTLDQFEVFYLSQELQWLILHPEITQQVAGSMI